jgi:hypothetical protein
MRSRATIACVLLTVAGSSSAAAQVPTSQKPQPSPPPDTVHLSLNGLDIALDAQNGSLRQMSSPYTGVILDAPRESAGLVDLAYPIQEFVPLRLGSRFSKASIEIDEKGGGATVTWDPLGPSRSNFKLPDGKVLVKVRITAAPDGRSVILQCTIENKSSAPVPQVLFPDLRGMRPLAGAAGTQLRFAGNYPVLPFAEDPIPPYSAQFYVNSGWKEYPPSTGTYGINSLRWLDFGGYQGGISIFQKAWGTGERPTVRTWRSQADMNYLRLMWEYKSGIRPGETWQSDEVWLTPHAGGWAKGIEVFRDYVQTKHPRRPLPARIRDGLGFRTVFMIQAPEKDPAYAAFRFTDIPRLAADAREHGLSELCLWGWCEYFSLPFKVRTELGTREEFLEGVREAKDMGIVVCPFVSCVLVRNSFAERYGGTPGGPAWAYHPDMVPMIDPYYLAAGRPVQFWNIFSAPPQNRNWHADVTAAFKEWIDAGITSWSWDQVFADSPDSQPRGLTGLLWNLRKLAQAKDPDASFSGEEVGSLEFDGGVLDYTWNWEDYIDAGPTTNVMNAPRLNCNIEDSPRIVRAAFADNLFINAFPRKPDQPNGTALISEKPEMAKALKQVAARRKQFLPFFRDGIFIGDSVLSEASPGFVRGYQLGDRLLIIALNNQPQAMPLTVKSRLDLWLPKAERYEVKSYGSDGQLFESGRSQGPEWTGATRSLQPLEMAFFEIKLGGAS